jgi:thioredoxin reductase (NADPH)
LIYDVLIIGAGPAGLTAAIYTARAKLTTLVLEGAMPGGNAAIADQIDNYPGFPFGITGSDLMNNFLRQAERMGAEIKFEEVIAIKDLGEHKIVTTNTNQYTARSVIIAIGAKRRKLEVLGEEDYFGRGVSYCATCDGPFFQGVPVAVVGGGDAAINEALFLSNLAARVYVIHRNENFRANRTALEKAYANEKITILTNKIVKKVQGNDLMRQVIIQDTVSKEETVLEVEGLFISIGLVAAGEFIEGLPATQNGYILCDNNLETSIPGVFVAGDIRQKTSRQVATAVGDGTQAAMAVSEYLKGR